MTHEKLAEIFQQLKEKAPVFYEELEKQLVKNAESHGIKVVEQNDKKDDE